MRATDQSSPNPQWGLRRTILLNHSHEKSHFLSNRLESGPQILNSSPSAGLIVATLLGLASSRRDIAGCHAGASTSEQGREDLQGGAGAD